MVCRGDDVGEVVPSRVAEVLFPLHLIVPAREAIPREFEVVVRVHHSGQRDRIRAEDGVE